MGRELEARSEANIGWPFALFEGLCAGAAVATRSDMLLRVPTVFHENIPRFLVVLPNHCPVSLRLLEMRHTIRSRLVVA